MRLEDQIRRMMPVSPPANLRTRAAALLAARARELFAAGEAVALVVADRELTTGEASRLLGVSRQYLVRLADAGRIPMRKTGKHRRVLASDVLELKERREMDRAAGVRAPASIARPSRSAAIAAERERERIATLSPRERVVLALRLGRRNRSFARVKT